MNNGLANRSPKSVSDGPTATYENGDPALTDLLTDFSRKWPDLAPDLVAVISAWPKLPEAAKQKRSKVAERVTAHSRCPPQSVAKSICYDRQADRRRRDARANLWAAGRWVRHARPWETAEERAHRECGLCGLAKAEVDQQIDDIRHSRLNREQLEALYAATCEDAADGLDALPDMSSSKPERERQRATGTCDIAPKRLPLCLPKNLPIRAASEATLVASRCTETGNDTDVSHRENPMEQVVSCTSVHRIASQNGEGGIRTRETGVTPSDGLANRWFQPLTHLSTCH